MNSSFAIWNPLSDSFTSSEFMASAGLAAATTAALIEPKSAEAGDASFMNNVPDRLFKR